MSAREEAVGRVIAAAREAAALMGSARAIETLAAVARMSFILRDLDALDVDEPEPVTLRDAFMGGAMYVAYAVSAGKVPTKASVNAAADIFIAHAEEAGPTASHLQLSAIALVRRMLAVTS